MSEWVLLVLPLLAVPIVLLFRFVGCTSFQAAPAADFGITVQPLTVNANRGAAVTAIVSVAGSDGFTAFTTLTLNDPAQVATQVVFSPNPVQGQSLKTVQSTLTFNVAAGAPTGSRGLTIRGSANEFTHDTTLTVNVAAPPPPPPPAPDYTLSLTPPSATVARGQTLTLTVNINRVGGFAGAVTLTSTPGGATFVPQPAAGAASTLTFDIPATQPLGPVTLIVNGTSPGHPTRTVSGEITVTA